MLEFLKFSRAKADQTDRADTAPAARAAPTVYPTATQREMVRLTLHTLLKRHGIPASWLTAEVGALPTTNEPEGLSLRLVIQHWHPGFGLYAPAIQTEMMEGLKRFDPAASATRYQIFWKFAADCGCPHSALPASGYWSDPVPKALEVQPLQAEPVHKPKFDLPDRRDDDEPDNGFAATQMHDIR